MAKHHPYSTPTIRCARLNEDYLICGVSYGIFFVYKPQRRDHRIPGNGASLSSKKRKRIAKQHAIRIIRDPYYNREFYSLWRNSPYYKKLYFTLLDYVAALCDNALTQK